MYMVEFGRIFVKQFNTAWTTIDGGMRPGKSNDYAGLAIDVACVLCQITKTCMLVVLNGGE